MRYIVTTRDVDGSSKHTYKVQANAIKRFEDMLGYSIDIAIAEQYHATEPAPKLEQLRYVRGVSDFGCVVSLERAGEQT